VFFAPLIFGVVYNILIIYTRFSRFSDRWPFWMHSLLAALAAIGIASMAMIMAMIISFNLWGE